MTSVVAQPCEDQMFLERKRLDARISRQWQGLIPSQLLGILWCMVCVIIIVNATGYAWTHPNTSGRYVLTMLVGCAWFFGVGHLVYVLTRGKEKELRPGSASGLQIGQFTDGQILSLVQETADSMPGRMPTPKIFITEHKDVAAWTLLNWLWPAPSQRVSIRVSEGALHYLSARELQAVLAHEMAHHLWRNRIVPDGWHVTQIAMVSLIFLLYGDVGGGAITLVLLLNGFIARMASALGEDAFQRIEHVCDLVAARVVGVVPMANVLLKMGEEEELSEIVMLRAVSQLARGVRRCNDDCAEELPEAFEEVRPYGRIFHENLFRHSHELVKKIEANSGGGDETAEGSKKSRHQKT